MKLIYQLQEAIQPTAYRPSQYERTVLAKIIVSTTPQLAYDQIARGIKLNAAKEKLVQLGFIEIIDGEASLTLAGEELAKAQALLDDTGEPGTDATSAADDTERLPTSTDDGQSSGLDDF